MANKQLSVRCCIAGGGPAGMMLGFLLARQGVEVAVLEKHADFLRDFRGDTIHPSTLQVMHELGLLDELLKLPHDPVDNMVIQVGHDRIHIADLSHLPTRCKFVALMPQWDFLDFLAAQAKHYPTFRLLLQTQATGLIFEGQRVAGVSANDPSGPLDIRADLVIAADGRHSTLRKSAGFEVNVTGAPMDVLWMRLSRKPDDPPQIMGKIAAGRMMVMLNRGSYWQCAYLIKKGGFDAVRQAGLEAFRADLTQLVPWLGGRPAELLDWDQVKLLTVAVDRLERWHRPGLLCIGDAAHAMSPIGGVGINLAIQDAVATANILGPILQHGSASDDDLARVQHRRMWPTKMTQGMQIQIQNRLIDRVLAGGGGGRAPLLFRLFNKLPVLRRIPARLIGLGFRPEHVRAA
jgi:2-polyprenyl-6-methoxyphenol hydroxylase-like FAD-dependent oxidoreductase